MCAQPAEAVVLAGISSWQALHLDRHNSPQAFPDVVPRQVGVPLFQRLGLTAQGVDCACERSLEPIHVGAPINGLDAVHKAQQSVRVGVTAPLQSYLHFHTFNLHMHTLCLTFDDST